jgi:pimeloyl-ACP methyl ester carboxylesterase
MGGTVAEILAGEHPDRVAALHLTNVAPRRAITVDPAQLAPDAAAYLDRAAHWVRTEGGYIAEQSTRRLRGIPGGRPLRRLGTARGVCGRLCAARSSPAAG